MDFYQTPAARRTSIRFVKNIANEVAMSHLFSMPSTSVAYRDATAVIAATSLKGLGGLPIIMPTGKYHYKRHNCHSYSARNEIRVERPLGTWSFH